jgi:trehalose 6-phosphate synthase/phosphatase
LAGLGADFILAIGDDWTDEDLFRALPANAYSVRVGLANTAARYYLGSHTAVRRVLRELSQSAPEGAINLSTADVPSQVLPPKTQGS